MGFTERDIKTTRKEKKAIRRKKEFIKKNKLNIFEISIINQFECLNLLDQRGIL